MIRVNADRSTEIVSTTGRNRRLKPVLWCNDGSCRVLWVCLGCCPNWHSVPSRAHDDRGQSDYENGVFKPKEPVQLQEHTEVEVLVPTQALSDDDPTGWAAAQTLIGFIDDARADMAEHHDQYLYGRPRD